jgi:hypothetical protein
MILSWIILAVILLMPIYIFSTSIQSSIRLFNRDKNENHIIDIQILVVSLLALTHISITYFTITSSSQSLNIYYWIYPLIILLYYFIMPFYYHFHIKKININDPSYNTSYLAKENLVLSSFLLSIFIILIIWNIAVYNIVQFTRIFK